MTSTSKTIIFFGTEDFSLVTLEKLISSGYHIAAVVTKPDSHKGRGHKVTPPAVKVLAEKHDIPVWQPQKVAEVNDKVAALAPVAGVLVSYGKIIPQSTIGLFSPGIINVHPSLLPKYRGPSPIESAILSGDSETGVTIMQLSAAMDAGPVYAAKKYPLNGTETRPELYTQLGLLGSNLLVNVLPGILDGSHTPTPQDDQAATYCKLLQKTDGLLNPSAITAIEAERKVRAYLGFPKTKIVINDNEIIITKAHVTDQQKTPLDIQCHGGAFLSIDELIAPSGRRMNSADFLRGYAA